MNDTKEKSAVGAATPATEMNNNTSTDIISGNEGKIKGQKTIKAVIQRPGEISEIVETENTVEALNELVGGMSTAVTIPDNSLTLIMNMNSNRRGTPNLKTLWGRIYGTVLITATEDGQYVSLTPEQIQSARGWLLKHTYEEDIK